LVLGSLRYYSHQRQRRSPLLCRHGVNQPGGFVSLRRVINRWLGDFLRAIGRTVAKQQVVGGHVQFAQDGQEHV